MRSRFLPFNERAGSFNCVHGLGSQAVPFDKSGANETFGLQKNQTRHTLPYGGFCFWWARADLNDIRKKPGISARVGGGDDQ